MTSEQIGINEARPILGDLITRVQQGADVVLTRNGNPAARLIRYQEEAMLMPVEEETVKVTELRPGDKIIDDGDELFVTGEPTRRYGKWIVPLAETRDAEATPFEFTEGHRVTRVLVDAPAVERMPGSHL